MCTVQCLPLNAAAAAQGRDETVKTVKAGSKLTAATLQAFSETVSVPALLMALSCVHAARGT